MSEQFQAASQKASLNLPPHRPILIFFKIDMTEKPNKSIG